PISYRDDAMGGVEAECECELTSAGGVCLHVEISRRRALRDTVVFECDRGRFEVAVFEPALMRLTLPTLPVPMAPTAMGPPTWPRRETVAAQTGASGAAPLVRRGPQQCERVAPIDLRVDDREFEWSPLRTVFARQLSSVVSAVRGEAPPV